MSMSSVVRIPEEDPLLTRREAARLAGVHYNSLRKWEEAGLLRSQRKMIGAVEHVMYRRSDVLTAVRQRMGEPKSLVQLEVTMALEQRLAEREARIAELEAEVEALRKRQDDYADEILSLLKRKLDTPG